MPVELPTKKKTRAAKTVSLTDVMSRVLNWAAVAVCIGMVWWALVHGLYEVLVSR